MNKLAIAMMLCAVSALAADTVIGVPMSSVAGGKFYPEATWGTTEGGKFYAQYGAATSAPPEESIYDTNLIICLMFDEANSAGKPYTNVAPCGTDYNPTQFNYLYNPKWTNDPNGLAFAGDGAGVLYGWPSNNNYSVVGVPYAISLWLKPNVPASTTYLWAGAFNYHEITYIRQNADGTVSFVPGGTSSSTTALTNGGLYHVCMVWDKTNRYVYVNGVQEDIDADTTGTTWSNDGWRYDHSLGGWVYNENGGMLNGPQWNGIMAAYRFYWGISISSNKAASLFHDGVTNRIK